MRSFKITFWKVSLAIIFLTACNSDKDYPENSLAPQNPPSHEQAPPSDENVSVQPENISFEKFGIIREFGEVDKASLFGLLPNSGKLEITNVAGPEFIETYAVGELNSSTINKIFLKSSKPPSADEKEKLLSDFNGATIIYAEEYDGQLCTHDEIEYKIIATGKIENTDIEITFQFKAIPNSNGNCAFHTFSILTKYVR